MSSNFVVSARKYRPMRFEDVVGQKHVWQTLKNAIKNNHLAQAFLFSGPRGVGKTTCARILAKVLNCLGHTEDIEPCDQCSNCKAFRENSSMNVYELDAASNNSVEDIRSLTEQVRFAPQQGKYKIYIIDEVHMLSQAAFNAFLKTLEEPPHYAIFILATTEKHKILDTILSRCQNFEFNRIQVRDMVEHLQSIAQREGIAAEEEALNIIAEKADGGLRDALSIFDRVVSYGGGALRYQDVIEQLNILDYSYYAQIVDALLSEDWTEVLLLFDAILKKGFESNLFIAGLAEHLRYLLLCQDSRSLGLLQFTEAMQARYKEQAQLTSTSFLLTALNLCNECAIHYKLAQNKRYHVELYLLKMAHIQRALSQEPPSLSEKKKPEQLSSETSKNLIAPVSAKEASPELPKTPPAEETKIPDAEAKKSDFRAKLLSKKNGNEALDLQKLKELEKEEERKKQEQQKQAWPLEQSYLDSFWKNYLDTEELSPSALAIYKACQPLFAKNVQSSFTIEVQVPGKLAQEELLGNQSLLQKLRQSFACPNLQWAVEIQQNEIQMQEQEAEAPKRAKPQTARDKYRYFLEKNPLLKELQKKFQFMPKD